MARSSVAFLPVPVSSSLLLITCYGRAGAGHRCCIVARIGSTYTSPLKDRGPPPALGTSLGVRKDWLLADTHRLPAQLQPGGGGR